MTGIFSSTGITPEILFQDAMQYLHSISLATKETNLYWSVWIPATFMRYQMCLPLTVMVSMTDCLQKHLAWWKRLILSFLTVTDCSFSEQRNRGLTGTEPITAG